MSGVLHGALLGSYFVAGGATFSTDFSEYSTGVIPSDWTARGIGSPWTVQNTGDIGTNNVQSGATGSNANRILTWDDLDSPGTPDVEILTRIRTPTISNNSDYPMAFVRNVNTYDGYAGGFKRVSGVNYAAITLQADTDTAGTVLNSATTTFAVNVWYWVRFQAIGTALKLKVWSGAVGDEPGAWTVETTDATLTAAGRSGVYHRPPYNCRFDYFSIALGGETAPSP